MAAILDPSHKPSAALLERTVQAFRYACALAAEINSMTAYLLGLSDEELESWLNSQTPENLASLLAVHGRCGERINQILAETALQLQDSGQQTTHTDADVRPFQDKLAAQGRGYEYVDGSFVVFRILA